MGTIRRSHVGRYRPVITSPARPRRLSASRREEAFGLHEALAHVDEPLAVEPAAALFGGTALYLLGHVGFNRRSTGSTKAHRLVAAVFLVLLVPVGTQVDALAAVALTTATILLLIAYENARYGDARREIRRAMLLHGHGGGSVSGSGSGATVPPAH